jgi:acyl-CoA thioesterase-2
MEKQPTSEELVRWLVKLLDVKPGAEEGHYAGRRKRGGVGRVFGGQVIAQALAAAERTVAEDRAVHSLHAYFLRGGSEDHEIDFRVERDFDGGSFSNRRVIASQQGTPILNLTASFHRHEPGITHQDAMPAVAGPDGLDSEADLRAEFLHLSPPALHSLIMRPRPLDMRPVHKLHWMGLECGPPELAIWFRTVAPLPDDPRIHRAVLAYASDHTLLATATVPHDLSWLTGDIAGASLDHAVWFHDSFRADEWLLYATDSPWAGRSRGFNRGRIYTQDGRLVAETAQEGLVRRARKQP